MQSNVRQNTLSKDARADWYYQNQKAKAYMAQETGVEIEGARSGQFQQQPLLCVGRVSQRRRLMPVKYPILTTNAHKPLARS